MRLSVFLVMLTWTMDKLLNPAHAAQVYTCFLCGRVPEEAHMSNRLFFAAWPMLAASFTLYTLQSLDTRWVIGRS